MTRTPSLPQSGVPVPLGTLWTDSTLVAAAGAVASPWFEVTNLGSLFFIRAATGGVYALEVDWSRDGVTVDVTQAVTVANSSSAQLLVAARFARFRVRNTDGTAAFTAHRTTVSGR